MKKIVFILTCIVCTAVYGQSGNWLNQGTIQEGISGAQAFVSYGNIYVVGGYSDSMQATVNWVRTYDPFLNQVQTIGNMLRKRKDFVAGIKDKLFYFAGGEEGLPAGAKGSIESFQNVMLNAAMIDSSLYFNRSGGVGGMVNGYLFLCGGIASGSSFNQDNPYIFEYNLSVKGFAYSLDSLTFSTSPVTDQMSATIGNNIFLLGGINNTVMKDIYIFNATDNTLKKAGISLQQPRAGGQAIYNASKHFLYVFGGYNESSGALNSGEVYFVYDTLIQYYQPMPAMNFARKDFMSVLQDNLLYAFGGEDENGRALRQVEVLSINPTTGVTARSLSKTVTCELLQNYPNPFNPSTRITYILAGKSRVSLRIYDGLGRQIQELVNGEQDAGTHSAQFTTGNIPSGLYIYQLRIYPEGASPAQPMTLTKKMLLLR